MSIFKIIKKFKILLVIFAVSSNILLAGIINFIPQASGGDGSKVDVIQVQASNKAQFFVNDFVSDINLSNYEKYDYKSLNRKAILAKLGSIGSMTIINKSTSNVSLKLGIKVGTLEDGDLGEFTTDPTVFAIDIEAGQTRMFDSMETYSLNQSWIKDGDFKEALGAQARYDKLKDAAILQYSQTREIVPARNYVVSVALYDKNDVSKSNPYRTVVATIYQPPVTGKTELKYPKEGDQVPYSNMYPTFIWSTDVRTGVDLRFTFSLYDYKDGDSVESSVQRTPKYQVADWPNTTMPYPSNAQSLEIGKKYIWKIEAFDGLRNKIGEAKTWFQFQMPAAANLNNPMGEVDKLPILFSWREVEMTDKYLLYISEKRDFVGEYKKIEINGLAQSIDDSVYNFEPGKTYFWKIGTLAKNGEKWSEDSQVASFLFNQNVALQRPDNNDTVMILPPQFNWSLLQGAAAYKIKIADNNTFQNSIEHVVNDNGFKLDDPNYFGLDKVYYWKVQALSNVGSNWGRESTVFSFKTPQRDKPQIFSPIGEVIEKIDQVRFSWQMINWAKRYEIFLADNREFRNPLILKMESSPYNYQDNGYLNWEKQYFWKVIPFDENNKSFDKFSDIGNFFTPSRKNPDLKSPIGGEELGNMQNVIFRWDKVDWAEKYKIYIADNPDLRGAVIKDTNNPPLSFQNDGFFSLGKTYFWQIEPLDKDEKNYNRLSSKAHFTTKPFAAINLIWPAGDTLDKFDSVTIRWTKIDGVAGYQVLFSEGDQTLKNSKVFFTNENSLVIAGETNIVASKKYYVKVNSVDKDQKVVGIGSQVGVFATVGNNDNAAIQIFSPIGNITQMFPVLKWSEISNANNYLVKITGTGLGKSVEKETKLKQIDLETIMQIKPGETYKWQVAAYDKDGKIIGKMSDETSFTLPFSQIQLIDPIGNKIIQAKNIKLNWKGEDYIDEYKLSIGTGGNLNQPKTYTTKESNLEIKDVLPGQYSWQVSGYKKGEEFIKMSNIGMFELQPPLPPGKIELIDPVNKNIYAEKAILSWKGNEFYDTYRVKLSKSANLDNPRDFRIKESKVDISDLDNSTYYWQVQGLRDGKEVLIPSNIAMFNFQRKESITSSNAQPSSNGTVTDDINGFIEATPDDISKFGDFVKEFLKVNGAANLLENMVLDEIDIDGSKNKINKKDLDDLIQNKIEIKYIKVR